MAALAPGGTCFHVNYLIICYNICMNFYLLVSLIICGVIHAGVPRGVGVALQRRFPLVDGLWLSEGYLGERRAVISAAETR